MEHASYLTVDRKDRTQVNSEVRMARRDAMGRNTLSQFLTADAIDVFSGYASKLLFGLLGMQHIPMAV